MGHVAVQSQFHVKKSISTIAYQCPYPVLSRTKFVRTPDGKYGGLNPDGVTFNGMVGMLQRGEAHAAICGIALTQARIKVADPLNVIGFYE